MLCLGVTTYILSMNHIVFPSSSGLVGVLVCPPRRRVEVATMEREAPREFLEEACHLTPVQSFKLAGACKCSVR